MIGVFGFVIVSVLGFVYLIYHELPNAKRVCRLYDKGLIQIKVTSPKTERGWYSAEVVAPDIFREFVGVGRISRLAYDTTNDKVFYGDCEGEAQMKALDDLSWYLAKKRPIKTTTTYTKVQPDNKGTPTDANDR